MIRLLATLLAIALSLPVFAQSPPADPLRIPLWEKGAPGFESRAAIPEISREYWTRNINNPSITYYPARAERRTGAAIVIMPGGAHEFLVITSEGENVARWFAERGVAAFVLRYRLFRGKDSPIYSFDHAREDAARAIRTIRARATEFTLDPARVGVIGFSAGGELARAATLRPPPAPEKDDATDALSARPDFAILVYPGPLHGEENVAKDSPPLLLTAATDDECCSQPAIDLMTAYRAAGASVEMHLFAAGGHAFNLGERTPLVSLRHWGDRITDWMTDRGLFANWPPPRP
ncbi:alpha/beta hydrolase [Sphingomonas soli]|uniref:alpha/beta hydrolase n=1 Tax=Sphingomonas soli TaxID=266127 RepID=UPI000A035664|nr:alpha/beta hydrolase [Sphingomonas soli]